MVRFYQRWMLLSVHVLFAVMPNNVLAQANQCTQLFNENIKHRGVVEPKFDWSDDKSYIETLQRKAALGQVSTFFSDKWDTQIYYTKTADPNLKGEVPLVDPDSKAAFIFFHGSGTKNSGGKNFIANMNTLANMGYSAISMDMPFHSDGPRDPKYYEANYFLEWARSIVLEVKKSGKPVYLAGHSFGPDVMLELTTRYPKLMDGVIAISPAGFTKELSHWYDNYTTKMKFGGSVESNDAGGEWAAAMSSQFMWHRSKLADPTVVNKKLKLHIMSGNMEEYVPAPIGGENLTPIGENTYDIRIPLKKIFNRAQITIEPGIGHYIFNHTDANGINAVNRELLLLVDEDPKQMKNLYEAIKSESSLLHQSGRLGKRYAQDPIFKDWADRYYGPKKALQVASNKQDGLATKMMKEFDLAQIEREKEIHLKIMNTKTTHPDFYNKHKSYIDGLNSNKVDRSLFISYATEVLKK